jgi:phosphate-selective porin OprO/OprP
VTRSTLVLVNVISGLLVMSVSPLAQDKATDKPQKSVEERLADLEKQVGGDAMRVFWKDGLRFESADKRYKVKIGGRIHYDNSFFDPDANTRAAVESNGPPVVRIEDGSEFRRARIEMSGEVAERVEWAAGYDFGGGRTNFRGLYVGMKDLPFGNLRIGQMKEPFSLEQLTSSNNIPFIERSAKAAQDPAYNAGIMVYDAHLEERMTWAIGAFRVGTDDLEVSRGDGEWATTARVTGLPLFDEEGDDYVHLGLAASRRSPTDDMVSFSSRPEANLAPAYVSLSGFPAETVDLIGAEAAWVRGPLTVAGEYAQASIDGPSGATQEPTFSGYYAMASWLLTGESRPYSKASGVFGAVKPRENAFGKEHGLGAWEVLARISSLDLRDDGVDEGQLDDLTFGVNWYLNPNTRVMLNYILADLDPTAPAADGDTDILSLRVQFNF